MPTDGVMNPLARARLMARDAIKLGAVLYGHTAATDVSATKVTTDTGYSVQCRRVIVAVDGRLEKLLPELQGRVRTTRL